MLVCNHSIQVSATYLKTGTGFNTAHRIWVIDGQIDQMISQIVTRSYRNNMTPVFKCRTMWVPADLTFK